MSDALPQGWASAHIAELCDVPKEKGQENVVPYLEIGNVDIASKRYTLTGKPSVKGCRVAKKNDILVSKVRPTRGAIICIRERELQVSSAFTVLRNKGALAEKCLWHFLAWNRGYLNHLGESCTGTMYPTTSDEAVITFEVPLAPLPEQRRIVAKLETLLGKVDTCQQRLAKIPVLLKHFRQSVLTTACSGCLTVDWREKATSAVAALELLGKAEAEEKYSISDEDSLPELPDKWVHVPIGNIAEFQQGMQIAKKTRLKEPGLNRLPILRIGNYETGFKEDVDYVKLDEDSLIADPIDVILARTGETRGKILTGYRGVFHNNTFRINYDRKLIVREYLIAWLETDFVQSFIRNSSGRSAQPDLTHKAFGPCPIALPPLPEQQEIVRRVEGLFALANQLELRLAKARGQVDKLTPSLLARAFRGELVPQDPNDEPASVFLNRIRMETERKRT